jgi:hypothetical protein
MLYNNDDIIWGQQHLHGLVLYRLLRGIVLSPGCEQIKLQKAGSI